MDSARRFLSRAERRIDRAAGCLGLWPVLLAACAACGTTGAPAGEPPKVEDEGAAAVPLPFVDGPEFEALRQRAATLAEQGHIEEAMALLSEHLQAESGDRTARRQLVALLLYDGRFDKAIGMLRAGVGGDPEEDFPDWLAIGQQEYARAKDGPWVEHRRESVIYHPRRPDVDEAAFVREHLLAASAAVDEALGLQPDSRDALALAAIVRFKLGRLDDATASARRLCEVHGDDGVSCGPLGSVLEATGDRAAALAVWEDVAARAPTSPHAHESLARAYAGLGRDADAAEQGRWAEWLRWMPPFVRTPYGKELYRTFRVLAGHFESREDDDGEGAASFEETMDALLADRSQASSELLAAFCWHHSHDAFEEAAFEALSERYPDSGEVLYGMLTTAQSTCTSRAAARILADHGHPGLVEVLINTLPRDLNWPFDMDIAGALDRLGDPAAVGPLVQLLDVGRRAEASQRSPLADATDHLARLFARVRAALALGAFDTPEARQALTACLDETEEADLPPVCHAALYRLTGAPEHLAAVRAALMGGALPLTDLLLRRYLEERIATDAARALLEEISDSSDGEPTDDPANDSAGVEAVP